MADIPRTLVSLPLFPLGTVLYPGGRLPLRVFELRYLDMVRKCHALEAPFGVVALTSGAEVRQAGAAPETLAPVGTLCHVESLASLQAGLLTIQCSGSARFRTTQCERRINGLWIADVQLLPEAPAAPLPEDLQACADALARLLTQLAARAPGTPGPVPRPWHLDDCGWVANRWCELLPFPLAQKQLLLELESPVVRLELVWDFLQQSGIGTQA